MLRWHGLLYQYNYERIYQNHAEQYNRIGKVSDEIRREQGSITMSNKQIIWNYFKEKGFTDCGVSGLMGNIQAESNFKPTNLENRGEEILHMTDESYTYAVDNGSYENFVNDYIGYGIAQWTFWSRKQGLLNFAKQSGTSIGDLKTQLDFMYSELRNYPDVIKVLETTNDVKKASDMIMLYYERPYDTSEKALQKRATLGQNIYNEFTLVKDDKIKLTYRDYLLTAIDVIDGKYGNGEERVMRLKANGYNPTKIQNIVNIAFS